MQLFLKTIPLAFLAATGAVQALPGNVPGALESRHGSRQCPGDQTWSGWDRSCKCDRPFLWDGRLNKCHYPAWPKPPCGWGEKPYCGKGEDDYCEYDDQNDRCWDDGHNKIFCSSDRDLKHKLKEKCARDHPRCRDTQVWDFDSKSCKCPKGKQWRDDRCRHPAMPKPLCRGGKRPYCAKNKHDWTPYDETKKQCSDNGRHTTFCCEPGKEQQYCDNNWSHY